MRISEAFDVYRLDFIQFKNLSTKTEEAYSVTEKLLYRFFMDRELESLTLQDIRKWKQWLDKGRCPSTVRGYIICLRMVIKYHKLNGLNCIDHELIPVPKRVIKVPEYLTSEEVDKFIEQASKPIRGYSKLNRLRNQAIISLLYASGIRVSELCKLDRGSVRDDKFTVVGKGGKARLCFVDARTKLLLHKYLASRTDNHPALFISNQNGLRITPNNIQRTFLIISGRYGKQYHPHLLRHSFATNLLQNNCNMRYTQVMLGHSSLATTEIYTHVVDRDLQEVYAKFHTV